VQTKLRAMGVSSGDRGTSPESCQNIAGISLFERIDHQQMLFPWQITEMVVECADV
jgi:hypothetical protein